VCVCVCVCVCVVCFLVFVAFSRRSRKPPERKSAIFAERNCNSSPNFSFFFKSHDWSLRKVFSYEGKASLRLVRAKTAAWGERVNEKIYCHITPAVKSRYYSMTLGTLVVNILISAKYIIKCRLIRKTNWLCEKDGSSSSVYSAAAAAKTANAS